MSNFSVLRIKDLSSNSAVSEGKLIITEVGLFNKLRHCKKEADD